MDSEAFRCLAEHVYNKGADKYRQGPQGTPWVVDREGKRHRVVLPKAKKGPMDHFISREEEGYWPLPSGILRMAPWALDEPQVQKVTVGKTLFVDGLSVLRLFQPMAWVMKREEHSGQCVCGVSIEDMHMVHWDEAEVGVGSCCVKHWMDRRVWEVARVCMAERDGRGVNVCCWRCKRDTAVRWTAEDMEGWGMARSRVCCKCLKALENDVEATKQWLDSLEGNSFIASLRWRVEAGRRLTMRQLRAASSLRNHC